MKQGKPEYEDLLEHSKLVERKVKNLKHYQQLIQNGHVTNLSKISRDLAFILKGL